jgi:hypothetical protein
MQRLARNPIGGIWFGQDAIQSPPRSKHGMWQLRSVRHYNLKAGLGLHAQTGKGVRSLQTRGGRSCRPFSLAVLPAGARWPDPTWLANRCAFYPLGPHLVGCGALCEHVRVRVVVAECGRPFSRPETHTGKHGTHDFWRTRAKTQYDHVDICAALHTCGEFAPGKSGSRACRDATRAGPPERCNDILSPA